MWDKSPESFLVKKQVCIFIRHKAKQEENEKEMLKKNGGKICDACHILVYYMTKVDAVFF